MLRHFYIIIAYYSPEEGYYYPEAGFYAYPGGTSTLEVENDEDDESIELFDFSVLTIKKKKAKKISKFEKAANDNADAEEDAKMKKKKKATATKKDRSNLNDVEGCEAYTYQFMLKRVVDIVKAQHAEGVAGSSAFKLIEP